MENENAQVEIVVCWFEKWGMRKMGFGKGMTSEKWMRIEEIECQMLKCLVRVGGEGLNSLRRRRRELGWIQ